MSFEVSEDFNELIVTRNETKLTLPLALYEKTARFGIPRKKRIKLNKLYDPRGKTDPLYDCFYRPTVVAVVGARALYEGFVLAQYSSYSMSGLQFSSAELGSSRLMFQWAFFHPDGRVLAGEEWKSYLFDSTSRGWIAKFYPNEADFLKIQQTQRMLVGDRENTEDFLIKVLVKDSEAT